MWLDNSAASFSAARLLDSSQPAACSHLSSYFKHGYCQFRPDMAYPRTCVEKIRKGFHHDIRPGNILLFANDSKENFSWRLGTFGTDIETFAEMQRTDTSLEHGHPYPYQHPGLPHHASGKSD